VNTVAKVQPNSTVAVWGLGVIGLAVIEAAKTAGASIIIGVDTNPAKFELAKQFGATDCINPLEDNSTPIQQTFMTKYGGFDATFECVGNVNTMKAAIESVRPGSGVCCVIGVAKQGTAIALDPLHLLLGITIKGSCFGGLKGRNALPELVDKYLKKEIKVDEYITHRFKLDQINEAFDVLRQGKWFVFVLI
jgi:S-(hydroxymethyl)glutathione dehydrogenase/alcohol dehydrogenase